MSFCLSVDAELAVTRSRLACWSLGPCSGTQPRDRTGAAGTAPGDSVGRRRAAQSTQPRRRAGTRSNESPVSGRHASGAANTTSAWAGLGSTGDAAQRHPAPVGRCLHGTELRSDATSVVDRRREFTQDTCLGGRVGAEAHAGDVARWSDRHREAQKTLPRWADKGRGERRGELAGTRSRRSVARGARQRNPQDRTEPHGNVTSAMPDCWSGGQVRRVDSGDWPSRKGRRVVASESSVERSGLGELDAGRRGTGRRGGLIRDDSIVTKVDELATATSWQQSTALERTTRGPKHYGGKGGRDESRGVLVTKIQNRQTEA